MQQKAIPVTPPLRSARPDPAQDAARLLGWFGIAVLMVAAPMVGLLSRRSLYVLLPVGAGILGMAALLTLTGSGLRSVRDAFRNPVGQAGLFLVIWTGLSLLWTLVPEVAAVRFATTAAVIVLAVLIIASLPERRPHATLLLLPAGLSATALATLLLSVFGPASFRGGTEFDPSLLERSVLTIVVLLWPALGALAAFERWRLAAGLAAIVAAAITLASAPLAMSVFALAAVAFAAATDAPRRAARVTAAACVGLVLLAPALPFVLSPVARAIPMVGRSTVLAMSDWRTLVGEAPLRLLTGHGLDSARYGELKGWLPPHTPRSILFEVWYDLGLLGACALAAIFGMAIVAIGEAAPVVAPCLLGGVTATFTIAVLGVATAELWYVTLVSLQAIAFGLLARSSRSGSRPAAAGSGARPVAAKG